MYDGSIDRGGRDLVGRLLVRDTKQKFGPVFFPVCFLSVMYFSIKADGEGGEISRAEATHVLAYAGIPQVHTVP